MGNRYHPQCVRHNGDCRSPLVEGSDNGSFDVHTHQSICALSICHHRIWCHLCRCQYHFASSLCIEECWLLDRTRHNFSSGCMCSPSFLFLCTEFFSFWQTLTPLLIIVQVGLGLTDQHRSSRGNYSKTVSTAQDGITSRVGIPQDSESLQAGLIT